MSLKGVIVLIVALCAATAGYAVTIPVNTTLMTVANDGACSLVEAVVAANTDMSSGNAMGECPAGSGADSILLQVGATYTTTTGAFSTDPSNGPDALPPITSVIEIIGNGARLERSLMAGTLFRLIEVSSGGTLTLTDLTIANGHTGPDFLDNGYDGGCIFSKGHLVVTGSLVSGCHAGDGPQNGGNGGAIFATGGSLTVIGSTIELSAAGDTMNHSGGSGGAIAAFGIAVTIQDTTVSGNDAGDSTFGFGGDGGGISIEDGMLTLLRCTVQSNDAGSSPDFNGGPGSGGGISAETADVSIESSSIGSNVAGTNTFRSGNGGGLYMTGTGNSLRIAGSSIVSNASGAGVFSLTYGSHAGLGGGLFIYNVLDVAILGSELRYNLGGNGGNVTAAGGSAGDGGSGAAMWIQNVSTVHIGGSLIEQNTNGNGGNAFPGSFAGHGGDGPVSLMSVSTVTIEDTMLRSNNSGNGGPAFGSGGTGGNGGRGGALVGESSSTILMSRSSIVDNHAGDGGDGDSAGHGGHGGGLRFSGGEITIVNTTVSGNGSGSGGANGGHGGSGGGISADALLVMTNCTLSDNGAGSGNGSGLNGNGGNLHALVNTTITNSVLANNQFGGDCFNQGSMNNLNLGNNIVEDNSCGFTGGSDPRLAPLGTYGGSTLSHALCTAAGVPDASCVGPSPAIDAGADATCSDMFVKGIDQRAALRNAGAHCDIGAFESNGTASIAMTGDAALFPGGVACVGVRAADGYPLEALTAQMSFSSDFQIIDAQINPLIGPSTASDKQLFHLSLSPSSDLFTVSGGNGPVPPGPAFTAFFTTDSSTALGVYPITPLSSGNLVVTNCAGDCDGNGGVTLNEVQRCAGQFLGRSLCNLQDPGLSCTVVDSNFNGATSLAELQRCANHFVSSCP